MWKKARQEKNDMQSDSRLKLPLPDKETFACYSEEAKLNTLFDLLVIALVNQQDIADRLSRGRKVDLTVAGLMGLVGGFLAQITRHLTGFLR
jgi:hypothetical protein